MSYYWTPTCATCGEDGPKIRSGHSGLKFGPDHVTSTDLLGQWLEQHERHDVRLRGEGVVSGGAADWNPQGADRLRASIKPGTPQFLSNNSGKELRILANDSSSLAANRFVFPPGITEVVVPPYGTAVFLAEKPSRWQRLWSWIRRRGPALRWRYQSLDAAPKAPAEGELP